MFSRSKTRWDHCRLLAVFDGAPTSFARGLARTRTENITRANLMEFEVLQCHLAVTDCSARVATALCVRTTRAWMRMGSQANPGKDAVARRDLRKGVRSARAL